jgi:hypothetical protein
MSRKISSVHFHGHHDARECCTDKTNNLQTATEFKYRRMKRREVGGLYIYTEGKRRR